MSKFDNTFDTSRMDEIRRAEEERFIQQRSVQFGYGYIDLHGVTIDPRALFLVPEAEARAAQVAAFESSYRRISIAVHNPTNPATQKVIKQLEGKDTAVTIFMCSTSSLNHAWSRYKDQSKTTAVKRGVLDIDPDHIAELMNTFSTQQSVTHYITNLRSINSARRVSETLEAIFAGALALGASDIHIEPEIAGVRVRYRLDGVLHDVIDLERIIYQRLISRLKLLAGVLLNVRNEAQDGRFTFDVGEKQVEVRASVIPGASGESMVMRLLDPSVASFRMETLGLSPIMTKIMTEELKRPNGLIVTTGPTGSGKTTALYAFLRAAHTPAVKIITIEDPVEYKLDDIVQTQVADDYSFASGLRAILRQDPDIIMVGEIRDRDVAETAIHAAQTGHLVFSTLHTNSAVGAFPRLIDLGVDYRIFGSAVNIILGQRLVRVLCNECKTAHAASPEETELITKILAGHPQPPNIPKPYTLYEAGGCDACGQSGFRGRQAVFEAIRIDDKVEEAVLNDPREHIILEAARSQGIPTMVEDGIEKVLNGTTSLQELRRVVDISAIRGVATHTDNADSTDFAAHIV